jgi:FkbM family methyltransferase
LLGLLRPVLSNHVYTIRRGIAKGLKRKGGFGFIPGKLASSSEEEKFLASLNLTGNTVYDIGGYQGVFTMFFARAVGDRGRVVAYEPNPENFCRLVNNVQLNDFENVEFRQLGLGEKRGRLELVFSPFDPGRSSFREGYFESRNFRTEGISKVSVEVDSLDNQLDMYDLPTPDFVKIDVEEYEKEVLAGMKEALIRYKPRLFIELHGNSNNIGKVVSLLKKYHYKIYHVEERKEVDGSEIECIKGGDHIFCVQ